eukprot:10065042-Alexandrium_andersonii.AAC.1
MLTHCHALKLYTPPSLRAPHDMKSPDFKCARVSTGAVRGFFVAATECRMVELGHAFTGANFDRGADARLIVPQHPAAASTEAQLPLRVVTLPFMRSCWSCYCWRLWGWVE